MEKTQTLSKWRQEMEPLEYVDFTQYEALKMTHRLRRLVGDLGRLAANGKVPEEWLHAIKVCRDISVILADGRQVLMGKEPIFSFPLEGKLSQCYIPEPTQELPMLFPMER